MVSEVFTEQNSSSPLIRYYLSAVGTRAVGLYSTTKDVAPKGLKVYIETVENKIVSPYVEPVKSHWKKHADPVVDVLDNCISERIIPQAKLLESGLVSRVLNVHQQVLKPSEQYIRSSVHGVQARVLATRKKGGELVKGVTDQVYSIAQNNKTIIGVLKHADSAIDTYLPGDEEEEEEGSSDQKVYVPSRISKKIYSRIGKRVLGIYHYSSQSAKGAYSCSSQYVRNAVEEKQERVSKLFEQVFSALPDSDSPEKFAKIVYSYCPNSIKPIVDKSFVTITPVVNYAFSSVSKGVSVVRSVVVHRSFRSTSAQLSAPSSSVVPNHTKEDEDEDDTHHHSENESQTHSELSELDQSKTLQQEEQENKKEEVFVHSVSKKISQKPKKEKSKKNTTSNKTQ